jgi:hypothetical protein
MPEEPIPGSRVRATTKQGSLTVDEIAAMQPGGARIMDEVARRIWVLYYAAKAENWELARYMEAESEKALRFLATTRPKYAADLDAFVKEDMGAVVRALDSKDWAAFEEAFRHAVDASDVYHEKYNKRFLRFRLPDHPPEWFELSPR